MDFFVNGNVRNDLTLFSVNYDKEARKDYYLVHEDKKQNRKMLFRLLFKNTSYIQKSEH